MIKKYYDMDIDKSSTPPPSGKESVEGLALKLYPVDMSRTNINGKEIVFDYNEEYREAYVAGYTAAKAATPDSREEGKGVVIDENDFGVIIRVSWLKELIDIRNNLYTNLPVTLDLLDLIKWHINDIDNLCSRISAAPVTDKGVDVKFYLRKDDPVSDAVEFAEWLLKQGYDLIVGTTIWGRPGGFQNTTASLYTIFLTQKQKV